MPHEANINRSNGTKPNQEIEKISQKLEFPTIFQKYPNPSKT